MTRVLGMVVECVLHPGQMDTQTRTHMDTQDTTWTCCPRPGQALYNLLVDQPVLRITLEFQGKVLSSNEIHVCPSHLPLSHGSFADIVHL